MNWGMIDRFAKSLLKEAGHKIRISFYSNIDIESKVEANDLVTNIDRDVEKFFIDRIRTAFPEHRIFGEEGFGDRIETLEGVVWLLDPIDGTMNFIHQKKKLCHFIRDLFGWDRNAGLYI